MILEAWFPLGMDSMEKREGIFQSGNYDQIGKVREIYPKYWKNQEISTMGTQENLPARKCKKT